MMMKTLVFASMALSTISNVGAVKSPNSSRKLPAVPGAELSVCVPPLGSSDPLTLQVTGLPDPQTYRVVVMVGSPEFGYWDKTCGVNGHEPCPGREQYDAGFEIDEEGVAEDVQYVTVVDDANAPHVRVYIVTQGMANNAPEPAGAGVPAEFEDEAAVWFDVERGDVESPCWLNAPPVEEPEEEEPVEEEPVEEEPVEEEPVEEEPTAIPSPVPTPATSRIPTPSSPDLKLNSGAGTAALPGGAVAAGLLAAFLLGRHEF